MATVTIQDLRELIGSAIVKLVVQPAQHKLPGMNRPLNDSERLALAYLEAVEGLLNGKGLMKEVLRIELEQADSTPAVDEDADADMR